MKKFRKILILVSILAIAAFGVYAFFISNPKKIIQGITKNPEATEVTINDNINGIYLREVQLDEYYPIYTGCRINTIEYYIVVINTKYYYYRSSCIATYLLAEGSVEKLPIEFNKEENVYQLTYDDGVYKKTNISQIVPHEKVLEKTYSMYIESLEVILKQIEFNNHYKDIHIYGLYNSKSKFEFHLTASEYGYEIKIGKGATTIISYSFNNLDNTPHIYNYNQNIAFLTNDSTAERINYELQLADPNGIKYRASQKFPITVDDVEINASDYNVFLKRITSSEFRIYFSKYRDFCIANSDSNQITYYEFKITYNYSKGTFNDPEFVKKGLAKEGCGKVIPIKEES